MSDFQKMSILLELKEVEIIREKYSDIGTLLAEDILFLFDTIDKMNSEIKLLSEQNIEG